MTKFFHGDTALLVPEHVRPFLGDPVRQWVPGYSAFELATSWIGCGGIPASVRTVLDGCDEYRDARLNRASMEHVTAVPGRGFGSQTDALVFAETAVGKVVISVEGKVREPFDGLVSEWLSQKHSATDEDAHARRLRNRHVRLEGLKEILSLSCDVSGLRYQLLHRTAAAIIEARNEGAHHALMLVHSFCPNESSFVDFQAFTNAMQMPVLDVNVISASRQLGNVSLRLGWVADKQLLAAVA
jgi:hypothetical protein